MPKSRLVNGYKLPKTTNIQELEKHQIALSKFVDNSMKVNVLDLDYVAGVDVGYFTDRRGVELGACSLMVFDVKTKQVVEQVTYLDKVNFPYISGFLSFRELPLVLGAVEQLKHKVDLYVFDGNGILHDRKMGLATHASFMFGVPCMGISKNLYKLTGAEIPNKCDLGIVVGSYLDIMLNDVVYGRILRSKRGINPIYVSSGNYINLDSVCDIALYFSCGEGNIPIVTKLPDTITKELKQKYTY